MPTITVDKYQLFDELGERFTYDAFQDLCFNFGIELDEDTEDDPDRPADTPPQLKIEIPANRYDMLCLEGIVMNLNVFRGRDHIPRYRVVDVPVDKLQTITVAPETSKVRPLVAGAILRGVKFDQASYNSFISLQDKLHKNLARERTLVSIGTHDLDTIRGPFTYEALPPKDIKFVPLNQTKEMNGEELMEFYNSNLYLSRYLPIIRDHDVYPVILDADRNVCSLPPIINSNLSQITLDTNNVFIEITATDETKLDIVCNIMVAMFSRYCKDKFTVEPVRIVSEHNGATRITPSLKVRSMPVEADYLNQCCGLTESPETLAKLLARMGYDARPAPNAQGTIIVDVPPTRADVLHACDIMEDTAIAYGFNKLPKMAPRFSTMGQPLPINKLADIVRLESALAGWTEVMPLILCSHDENFGWLNRVDDGKLAVKLANPQTVEFQVVRTSLLPGLLKTIRENKSVRLPLQIFEASDVVYKDGSYERKARNERHWGAAFYGKTSGFETVHGLLDRVMLMLKIAFVAVDGSDDGYYIDQIDDPTFFRGRAAAIYLRQKGATKRIGEIGVLHPSVLDNFELKYPASSLELNLEVFL